MAEKVVADAIAQAYGIGRAAALECYNTLGDLGQVAAELSEAWRASKPSKAPGDVDATLDVRFIYMRLREIAEASGTGSLANKTNLLVTLLRSLEPVGANHLVRIPLAAHWRSV